MMAAGIVVTPNLRRQYKAFGRSRPILFALHLLSLVEVDVLPLLRIHILVLHTLFILDQNILVIINQIAQIVQALPLDDAVPAELGNALRIEHVAGGPESLSAFLGVDTLDQGREEQDHVSTFVHDRGSTVGAGYFAWQMMGGVFVRWIIPTQIVMAVGEVDVRLVKDGRPLKWSTM